MTTTKVTTTEKSKNTLKVDDLNKRKGERKNSKALSGKTQKKNEERSKIHTGKTYATLVEELRGTDTLWEDPDFPADSTSLFKSTESKTYCEYVWKRPKDIIADPKLFADGASRFDVQQGSLGNCWLIASVASLSIYEPLFKNVVPDDQDFNKNYIGAFRFRFWRFGTWSEVIVDDRIPTKHGKLVYMHSSESNEFWSALLEKAYAKLFGNYEALIGGSQSEAMTDFTGGLCETIKLNIKERPADLYKNMLKYAAQSSLMGCAIDSSRIEGELPNGLITAHAYSVTGVEEIKLNDGQKVELVRVRNPWGNDKEWKGRWSDNSKEWKLVPEDFKSKLDTKFQHDGEFWMNFDDFVENFTKLEVCHLGPESLDESMDGRRRWDMSLEDGSWLKNVNAGGCRNFPDSFVTNPQYRVEVIDPDPDDDDNTGTVIIGLMQKDMRKRKLDFFVIGYLVYKLKDPKCGMLDKMFFKFNASVAKSPGFINQREVCGRHKLPVGHYVIIPSTFNPNEEAQFLLRIFTQTPSKTKALDVKSGRVEVAKHLTAVDPRLETLDINAQIANLEKELEELFKKISGPNEVINTIQVQLILNEVIAKGMRYFNGFSVEVCRSMMALFDDNHTGRMEYPEFITLFKKIRLWKAAFKEFDVDESGYFNAFEFRNALNNLGLTVSNSLFQVLAERYTEPIKGIITFEDFLMAVIRLTNAFETMELQSRNSDKKLVFTPDEFLTSLLYM